MSKKKAAKAAKKAAQNNVKKLGKKLVDAGAPTMFSPAALAAAAGAKKVVSFKCTSPICLVSLQVGLSKATFVSNGQMVLPSGFHQMTMQVQGPAGTAFSLTATGAQMQPVNGIASLAGLIPITV